MTSALETVMADTVMADDIAVAAVEYDWMQPEPSWPDDDFPAPAPVLAPASSPRGRSPEASAFLAAASIGSVPTPRRPSVLDSGPVAPADLVRPVTELGRRSVPALPVNPALSTVLPDGLRRGSTVTVSRSMALLLAVLGGPSEAGAWCALIGMPTITATAAAENGIDLARLALVPTPGADWLTAVGALLDAMDVVAVCPPAHLGDGDIHRLGARARARGSVLVPYLGTPYDSSDAGVQSEHNAPRARWPRADVSLDVEITGWTGLGLGHGRLHARQVHVRASGRGSAGRTRTAVCWLPSRTGAIASVDTATERTGRPAWTAPAQRAG